MTTGEIWQLPAASLAEMLGRRELTASAVVDAYLDRIAAREPQIHAWTILDADAARARAAELDGGPIRGPLHGLPIGVKDIIDTGCMPTAYGSPIYAGHVPAVDAACVAAACRAGAIVLGKTASTEFATFAPTATVNPHDFSRTPGGSSSGSAAAVADHMVPLAFGTQTMGSVIRPASYCGIVGYKPTFGTIPIGGVKQIAPSLDTVGVFADSVEAAALFAGTVAGRPDLVTPMLPPRPLRIGLCRNHEQASVGPDSRTALESAAADLAAAGAQVCETALPAEYAALAPGNDAIYGFELARSLDEEFRLHRAALTDGLAQAITAGRRVQPATYRDAIAAVETCRRRFPAVVGDCDVLITASTTGEAPAGLESTGSPVMNRLWTLLGVPALSIPVARSARGLPVGLQIIGRYRDDALALAAAGWILEKLRGQAGRPAGAADTALT